MEVDKFLVISCEALNTAILEVNCALAFQELKNFFSLFLFFFIPLFLFTVLLKPVSLGSTIVHRKFLGDRMAWHGLALSSQ